MNKYEETELQRKLDHLVLVAHMHLVIMLVEAIIEWAKR